MKILYVFKKSLKNIKLAETNLFPKLFYGYFYVKNKLPRLEAIDSVSDYTLFNKIKKKIGIREPCILYNKINYLNKFDIIYGTTDGALIQLLKLKKDGLLKTKIMGNIMGTYDNTSYDNNLLYLSDGVIIFSKKLNTPLRKDIDIKKIFFVPFGIDINFFSPSSKPEEPKIICIGLDRKRDWITFVKCADILKDIQFNIYAPKNIIKYIYMPKNVKYMGVVPFQKIRHAIGKSKLTFLPSYENYYFSGQTSLFASISMKKIGIIPYDNNFDGYNFDQRMFYKRGCSLEKIVAHIEKCLRKDNGIIKSLEYNHNYIRNECNGEKFAGRLIEVFKNVI